MYVCSTDKIESVWCFKNYLDNKHKNFNERELLIKFDLNVNNINLYVYVNLSQKTKYARISYFLF